MSEEPRIRSQKLHCRRVYLDALLEKLQKVAEIAYITSIVITLKNTDCKKILIHKASILKIFEKNIFLENHELAPLVKLKQETVPNHIFEYKS